MTDPDAPTPAPTAEAGSRPLGPLRRLLIRHVGCVFALIAGSALVLAFGLFLGAGLAAEGLLRALSLGTAPADSLLIADFGDELGGLLFTSFVGLAGVLFVVASARRRSTLAIGLILALAGAGALVWRVSYHEFVALGRRGGQLVLVHLCPRPNTTLDARSITAVRIVLSTGPAGGGGPDDFYALELEADGRTWRSTRRIHRGLIEEARQVVADARAAAATR